MEPDLDLFSANPSDVAAIYESRSTQPTVSPKKRNRNQTIDLPRHREGERFIRGPIPLEWLKLASTCGNRAEAVSLLLWYAAGFRQTNPVKLSSSILSELSVHPRTAKRVLIRMQELGLVKVIFKRGRAPLVTITEPKSMITD